jgi:heme A synthase
MTVIAKISSAVLMLLFFTNGFFQQVSIPEARAGINLTDTEFPEPDNLPTLDMDLSGDEKSENPVQVVELFILNFIVYPIHILAGGVAIFMLVQAGMTLVLSRAEEDKLTEAKKTVIWSFVGLLLIVGSYTLVRNLVALLLGFFMES